MSLELIKNKLKSEEYDFLREDVHLGENIILLTTAGSYSYGTNNEESDIDIRGICIERENEYWGLSKFEQYDDKKTDTVIYGFSKIINLLLNNNPNIMELLGTNDEHIFIIKNAGKQLKDNAGLFLSKKVFNSFGGYATAQLRRLQNALVRDNYPQKVKENHILGSIQSQFHHFEDVYQKFTSGNIKLYTDKSDKKDFAEEIYIDINLTHYPLRDLKNIYSDMSNVIKDYESLNHRNNKKDTRHLNKHAMHLIRLLIMGTEILEKKVIHTYRSMDRDFLLNIRNGKYTYEEIFEIVDKLEEKFKYAYGNSDLPDKPAYKEVEELMIEIYKNFT